MSHVVFLVNSYGATGGVNSVVTTVSESLRSRGHYIEYVSLNNPTVPSDDVFVVNHRRQWTIDHPLAKDFPGKYHWKYALKALITPVWRLWRDRRFICYLSSLPHETVLIWVQTNISTQAIASGWNIGQEGFFEVQQFHSSYLGLQAMGQQEELKTITNSLQSLVVLTRSDGEDFAQHLGVPCYVLPNPINVPASLVTFSKQNKIVYMGRISPEKNILDAVKAFHRADTQDWFFEIYGDGPSKPELESYIDSNNLSDKIFLRGTTNDPAAVYRSARLNILTSVFEGLPMSILEAGSHGVLTLSYDCSPGVRELVQDTGWLLPYAKINQLSKCIESVIQNNEELSARSYKCFDMARRYNLKTIIDQYETIIQEKSLKSLQVSQPTT